MDDPDSATSKYVPNNKPPSSSTTPPRPPPKRTANIASASGTKRPMTPRKDTAKSSICPVCKKDLCHEKALNGHIRWHSVEEREAAGIGVARALASGVVVVRNDDVKMEGSSSKRVKLPDLNHSPPPEDDNS